MKTMCAAAAGVVLAVIAFGPPPARALPTVTGSNCRSSWVNNEDAINCFEQGEDEANAGVKHPHYVACAPNGEIYCCVDNDKGAQNCVGLSANSRATISQQIRAILAGQLAIRNSLNRLQSRIDALESRSAAAGNSGR